MWVALSVETASLVDVESPRRVVDACPACQRRARLVERAVTRPVQGGWRVWKRREITGRVLQCEKCQTCFELPETGLPPWEKRPERKEKDLTLARLRARYRTANAEALRWQKRSELAIRAGDLPLAEVARKMASHYEGEALAARTEIERLGGELPGTPRPDPQEQLIDAELAAMRAKAAARKGSRGSSPEPPDDASATVTTGETGNEGNALKAHTPRKAPEAPPPPPPSDEDDELAALKRKLKPRP